MAPSTSFFAIIVGAGSGTGSSVARRFAASYPVVLLSRSAASYQPVVDEIAAAGGKAIGIEADTTDVASLDTAFEKIAKELPDHKLAAAVYNPGRDFIRKPFLELSVGDYEKSLDNMGKGLFIFAQKTIPKLISAVSTSPHPPSLIVTSATAALRGKQLCSTFASGKFAQRGLTQSLAREFGPQGIHVALAIIDGVIDNPWAKHMTINGGIEDGKIYPDQIAESYWYLHTQHRSAFTFELDIRPYAETW